MISHHGAGNRTRAVAESQANLTSPRVSVAFYRTSFSREVVHRGLERLAKKTARQTE